MSDNSDVSTIERAFQLARAGACHSVNDIREQLLREGHANVLNHLQGMSIKKQLAAVLAARGATGSGAGDDDDPEG